MTRTKTILALIFVMPFVLQLPTQTHAQTKALNPDISLDGLFALSQFNRDNPLVCNSGHDPRQNGFNLQQIELTYGSNVDPYFRADANIVIGADGLEVEEAYATTTDFPANLQLKAGQFFTAFGRNNPTHPHSWDFANKPLVLARMFGGDGLRNTGLQLSWLSPLPWYSELLVSGQNSIGETVPSFRSDASGGTVLKMRSASDSLAMLRSNNYVSITDELSFNFGASYLNGPNSQADHTRTRIIGGDIYLKYRKPETLSFTTLQFEILKRYFGTTEDTAKDSGWYAQLNTRLGEPFERWHLGLRYDMLGAKTAPVKTSDTVGDGTGADLDTSKRYRISPVITFYPSEFSKVRLQYDYDKPDEFENAQQVVTLQLEFIIGAHGAHKF